MINPNTGPNLEAELTFAVRGLFTTGDHIDELLHDLPIVEIDDQHRSRWLTEEFENGSRIQIARSASQQTDEYKVIFRHQEGNIVMSREFSWNTNDPTIQCFVYYEYPADQFNSSEPVEKNGKWREAFLTEDLVFIGQAVDKVRAKRGGK